MLKKARLVLVTVIMASFVASFAYAQDVIEGVVIDDAYTMDYFMEPETEYCDWEPVMYRIDYTITGDDLLTYKAIIIINSDLGKRQKQVFKHKPGEYTMIITNVVGEENLGNYTINYKIKLKQGRRLVEVVTDTSEITVLEDCP